MSTRGRPLALVGLFAVLLLVAGPPGGPDVLGQTAQAPRESWPVAAFDGRDSFLVVWQEGWGGWGGAGTDLVGGIVKSASPEQINRIATPIVAARDSQEQPALAYGAGMFLVVWQDLRNGRDYDVYGARVTASGQVLDPDGFLIAGGPHNQIMPSVAFDGKEFAVAWADFRDGIRYAVHTTRVRPDGRVLPVSEAPLVRRPDQHTLRPRLVAAAHGLWLFWSESRWQNNLMTARLTTGESLALLPPHANTAGDIDVATDGARVLVTWPVLQGKMYQPIDAVAVIWNAAARVLVVPAPGTAVPFRRVGTGHFPEILWVKDGNNEKSARPSLAVVDSIRGAFDGQMFWAVWLEVRTFQSGTQLGQPVDFSILARRIDPASGAFLEKVPRVLLRSETPIRWPSLVGGPAGELLLVYESDRADGRAIIRTAAIHAGAVK